MNPSLAAAARIRPRPALALAALLVAAACSRQVVRERVPFTATDDFTWTGKTRSQVLEVFGRPSSTTADGEGGSILMYAEIDRLDEPPPQPGQHVTSDGVSVHADHVDDTTSADRTVVTKDKAKFWIGADDKVYRFWFSPQLYKKGVPMPPPPS